MGLVYYPTIRSPVSGLVSVTTRCADNAHRTSSSLSVSCTSSGKWSGTTPHCQCDTGYRPVTVIGRQICETQGKIIFHPFSEEVTFSFNSCYSNNMFG